MKKSCRYTLLLVITVMAAGIGTLLLPERPGLGSNANPEPAQAGVDKIAHTVVLETLSKVRMEKSTRYPGSVRASEATQLAFRVSGTLISVDTRPGSAVRKGQLLMQLDPHDITDSIQVLEAQLTGAQAQLDNASRNFERLSSLFSQQVIAQADFDRALTARDGALSTVKTIEAQLQTARRQLSYTALHAPYDGIITGQFIENHEMMRAGQLVLGLHDISRLEINIQVPENDILHHELKSGAPGKVVFPSLPGKEFPAALKEWNTRSEQMTHTYALTFEMKAPGGILPGMTAELAWDDPESDTQVLTVPAGAVQKDAKGDNSIWVFDPVSSKASRRNVTLGVLKGSSRLIVTSGLSAGDTIIVRGGDFITASMPLTPIQSKSDL
ncbi:MAG: efflux RND transporter periplasmic adaptor subunit [Pseudomonadota bacterium]